jgi:3-(3-hydroxy-phenyl)propionate hydroxylase
VTAMILNLIPSVARYVRDMRYIPKPFLDQGLVAPHTRNGEGSLVGRLLPMPRIRSGKADTRLDDILGPDFAIVGIETAEFPAELHAPIWSALGARAATVWKSPHALSNDGARGLPAFGIADDRFDEVFAAHRGQWLIVRPDRIVAAAVDISSFQEVTRFFERLLGVSQLVSQAAE